jgi:FG-GAP-like repeat
VTGHQNDNERPRCLRDGAWVVSNTKELNNTKDRHTCVTMDVNKDGYEDIICNVGAFSGRGSGYNELFMTNPAGGSIVQLLSKSDPNKVMSPSGLQKYPTMRNRVSAVLRNKEGEKKYVFMGTLGVPRKDGKPNQHRMFKNVFTAPNKFPYFVEVPGPWIRLFVAPCSVSGDFTGDGRDDLVVCNGSGPALLVRQGNAPDSFVQVPVPPSNPYVVQWHNARLADITGDGRKDLVVVTGPRSRGTVEPWYLIVFRGIPASPYFDFARPYFRKQMPYVPSDVEVLDVNRDGRTDIYVVQVDDRRGSWCGPQGKVIQLPKDVVPPPDRAPDVLFVGVRDARRFVPVKMQHSRPGCGAIAQRWDHRTMLLSQGSFDNSGYMLLLEW